VVWDIRFGTGVMNRCYFSSLRILRTLQISTILMKNLVSCYSQNFLTGTLRLSTLPGAKNARWICIGKWAISGFRNWMISKSPKSDLLLR